MSGCRKDSVHSRVRNINIKDLKANIPRRKPDAGYFMDGPELRIPSNEDQDRIHPGTGQLFWWHYGIDSNAVRYAHNVFPSSITGIPGYPVEQVILEDIEVIYEGGSEKTMNDVPLTQIHKITEGVSDYPEFSMFGELPAWGIFTRHINGLVMKNISVRTRKPDHRVSMLFMDVRNLRLDGIRVNEEKRPAPVWKQGEKEDTSWLE